VVMWGVVVGVVVVLVVWVGVCGGGIFANIHHCIATRSIPFFVLWFALMERKSNEKAWEHPSCMASV